MNNMEAKTRGKKFEECFARFGLPKIGETDYRRQFESR